MALPDKYLKKVKKSSKIRQGQKTLVSVYFFIFGNERGTRPEVLSLKLFGNLEKGGKVCYVKYQIPLL